MIYIQKMIEKYSFEFEEMHERILIKKESPLDVIREYVPAFEYEGIGAIGIVHYLGKYIKQR